MKIKDLVNCFACGAAVSLGSLAVSKGVKALQNPVRKAKIKEGFKNIKEAFTNKNGES